MATPLWPERKNFLNKLYVFKTRVCICERLLPIADGVIVVFLTRASASYGEGEFTWTCSPLTSHLKPSFLMLSLTRPAVVVFIAVVSLEDTANICILALPPL